MSDHTGRTIWDVTEAREGTYTGSCDFGIIEMMPGRDGALYVRAARDHKSGGVLGSGFTVNRISYQPDAQLTQTQDGRMYVQYMSMARVGATMREATDSARAAFHEVAEAAREALLEADPFAFVKEQIRDAKNKLEGYEEAEADAKIEAGRMRDNVARMEHALRIKQEVLRIKAEDAGQDVSE